MTTALGIVYSNLTRPRRGLQCSEVDRIKSGDRGGGQGYEGALMAPLVDGRPEVGTYTRAGGGPRN